MLTVADITGNTSPNVVDNGVFLGSGLLFLFLPSPVSSKTQQQLNRSVQQISTRRTVINMCQNRVVSAGCKPHLTKINRRIRNSSKIIIADAPAPAAIPTEEALFILDSGGKNNIKIDTVVEKVNMHNLTSEQESVNILLIIESFKCDFAINST